MQQVNDILESYPAECRPRHVEPLGSAGGMSGARFWRIAAERGALVLRRWPSEHPTADRLRFIHAVLRHAARGDITVLPLPIATRDGSSFVEHAGYLWELTPWLRGTADYEQSPSTEKLIAAIQALAQFHVAAADFPTPPKSQPTTSVPSVTGRLTRLRQLAHGGIQELSRAIANESWPELTPLACAFLNALPRALPRAISQLEPLASAPLPLQPCIRDVWHDHVLFTGNEVTGVIDFGALDIDTPATDIARLLGSLVGDDAPGWRTGLAAYSTVRPLSQNESRAVVALDASGTILAGCNWIRWLYIERRAFENRAQVIERFRRIAARVQSMAA
jgi:homoserine kinase type II